LVAFFLLVLALFFLGLPTFLLFLPAAFFLLLLVKPLLLRFPLAPLLGLLLTTLFLLFSAARLVRALLILGAPAILLLLPLPVGVDCPDNLVNRPLTRHGAVEPMQIREPKQQAT
jgi:hypothetical protein